MLKNVEFFWNFRRFFRGERKKLLEEEAVFIDFRFYGFKIAPFLSADFCSPVIGM